MVKKVLITVKTYPIISKTYEELVCTAGFFEDGTFIRIYPVPFRKLDGYKKYKLYQWITIDLSRNFSDPRPNTFKPRSLDTIKIGEIIKPDKYWINRKKIIMKNVRNNLLELISEAQDKKIRTSLAVYKPTEIMDFVFEKTKREWDEKVLSQSAQITFFDNPDKPFKIVDKLPYKFSYIFKDINGKKRKLMNEEWEIGALYWNCLKRHNGNEMKACEDVRKKYFDDFAKTKDLYFYLGTTRVNHFIARNPFIIIGTIRPHFQLQQVLFE